MEKRWREKIKVIAFDADDTLWETQIYFDKAEDDFCNILSEYGGSLHLKEELFKTETGNMQELGFGSMAFTISMVETALKLTDNKIDASKLAEILGVGRGLLRFPVVLLPGVRETLETLKSTGDRELVLLTKGNPLEQERKINCSGLRDFFDRIEIVSDKNEGYYHEFLGKLNVNASEFVMIGNSFKSDIAPVLAVGGYGVYIPYHTTWRHEKIEEFAHERLLKIRDLRELIPLLF